ncbi:MAG TPA: peptide MFS transporter [Phycisphaerae bacterium]|nr:peptide MFS transporter [Phycisphaerae bacterium]HNU45672.1 peptide MFS transporter [Phycisphaerae bacterium]
MASQTSASGSNVSQFVTPDAPPGGELLGHPKGLFVLFFTEMWERFSFYTMRGILTLYLVQIVLAEMTARDGEAVSGGLADQIYGAYLGFVYAAPLVGGMLADRLLGQRRAIYIGGILMALAHFTLATHAMLVGTVYRLGELNPLFFIGLGLLACGNGFFKPNISTIVGTLYRPEDARRDSAFTIFYMGINVGACASSFMSGAAQKWGWYLGYLAAGIGMIVSVVLFFSGRGTIAERGLPPAGATLVGRGRLRVPNAVLLLVGIVVFIPVAAYLMSIPRYVQYLSYIVGIPVLAYLIFEACRASREEAGRMVTIIVLCMFSLIFWGFFELQGSTITRFAEDKVDRLIFGWELPTAFVANVVNPLLVIFLGIPFTWLWVWLDRRHLEPSSPLKFSLGLLQLALGFLVLWIGASQAGADEKSPLVWLMLAYILFTTGELCLSPVGLSMVTKLSPVRMVGVFMGFWFLVSAVANVITGGKVGPLTEQHGYGPVFLGIAVLIGAAAVVLFVLSPLLKRLMHGIK